jgi:hypothetical protein
VTRRRDPQRSALALDDVGLVAQFGLSLAAVDELDDDPPGVLAPGVESEGAAARHPVERAQDQADENVAQIDVVAVDRGRAVQIPRHREPDAAAVGIVAPARLGQRQRFVDDRLERDRPQGHLWLARDELLELTHRRPGFQSDLPHHLEPPTRHLVGRGLDQELGVSEDRPE